MQINSSSIPSSGSSEGGSRIFTKSLMVLILTVLFFGSQHQFVKPRKLSIGDQVYAKVDRVSLKDAQSSTPTVPIRSTPTAAAALPLEDVDQAIAKANLVERQVNYDAPKKDRRQQQRERRKQHQERKHTKIRNETLFPDVLPPLDSLIGDLDENITGNVQPLLDFAIVGFGKCGTTALINWLDDQPEINTIPKEALHLARKRPALMVEKLYHMKVQHLTNAQTNPDQSHLGRLQGFKNPSDVRRPESMAYLRQHWPQTKLIITLRHPVHWFKSLYNFLLNEMGRKPKFLHHTSLIGGPHKNTAYAHTGKGEFHAILSLLGKTNMTDDAELDLLKGFLQQDEIENWPQPLPNPIFLLETTQMSDQNETRTGLFRKDLQRFLGLQNELPPVPHVRPGKDHGVDQSLKMDMCDPENDEVRQELVRISRMASQWIRRFFLDSPDVVVSSREHLEEILATDWMRDPCDAKQPSTQQPHQEAKTYLAKEKGPYGKVTATVSASQREDALFKYQWDMSGATV